MAKADLEEMFEMVRPGDTVEIRSELDDETAQLFGLGQSTQMADTQDTRQPRQSAVASNADQHSAQPSTQDPTH